MDGRWHKDCSAQHVGCHDLHSLFCILMTSFIMFVGGVGCVAPLPIDEYNLARASVLAAHDAGAERLASGLWLRADEQYRRGQKFLEERDNESAKACFLRAIEYSEKAENAARLKKFETGEVFQ